MAAREELYRAFGPKLIEANSMLILEQLNVLRMKANLPQLTMPQYIDALKNKLDSIPDYYWMEEEDA